jgi:hypothetical protein
MECLVCADCTVLWVGPLHGKSGVRTAGKCSATDTC